MYWWNRLPRGGWASRAEHALEQCGGGETALELPSQHFLDTQILSLWSQACWSVDVCLSSQVVVPVLPRLFWKAVLKYTVFCTIEKSCLWSLMIFLHLYFWQFKNQWHTSIMIKKILLRKQKTHKTISLYIITTRLGTLTGRQDSWCETQALSFVECCQFWFWK